VRPGALGRTGARTSDQPFLIFWFFFIKEKEKDLIKFRVLTSLFLFIRSFVLTQKNQKVKNAGSPPGGIQPTAPGRLSFQLNKDDDIFISIKEAPVFKKKLLPLIKLQGPLLRYAPRCVGPNGCADERSAVLDFLFLFHQGKRKRHD